MNKCIRHVHKPNPVVGTGYPKIPKAQDLPLGSLKTRVEHKYLGRNIRKCHK